MSAQTTNIKLQPGDAGVKDTISLMRQYAREYADNISIQDIVAQLASYCDACTLKNIFDYVVKTIRYEYDPPYMELVKSPKHTILGNKKYGDCDDLSVALASMFLAAGYPVMFKTIAWKPEDPNQFSHVYLLVNFDGGWIPMDPTMGLKGFGNEIKGIKRQKTWRI